MNTFSLEEKTVLITGGLGGYGLAICELILKRKGRVLLADIKAISEAEALLANQFKDAFEAKSVMYTKCDVTSEADIEAAFVRAQKDLVVGDGHAHPQRGEVGKAAHVGQVEAHHTRGEQAAAQRGKRYNNDETPHRRQCSYR